MIQIQLKQGLGIGLAVGGVLGFLFPDFNGVLGGPIKTSLEHRELVAVICFIGGVILYYMPTAHLVEED